MMRKTPVGQSVTGLPVSGERLLPNADDLLLYDYIQYIEVYYYCLMIEYFCIS